MSKICIISMMGRFRIEDGSGNNLTPSGKKSQGLLALLASSPRMERSKSWLQDKLWSDREQTQGSASLRTSLNDIRKALGIHAEILISKHGVLSLDPNLVEISTKNHGEYLEGMDVRDPEFEAWLTQARMRSYDLPQDQLDPPRDDISIASGSGLYEMPVIHFVGSASDVHEIAWGEGLIIDSISRSVQEALSADVYIGRTHCPPVGIRVQVHLLSDDPGQTMLRLTVEDVKRGRRIWSTLRGLKSSKVTPANDPELLQLINLTVDVLGNAVGVPSQRTSDNKSPNKLCRLAIRKMFSMEEAQVAKADILLEQAYDMDPKAIYLSWRAQLRTIQKAERHSVDNDVLLESAKAYMSLAVEMEPHNSMVLAAAANANLFLFHNTSASHDIAKRSISMNSSNPLAWWAMSASKLYSGDTDTSYQMASLARRISVFSPYGYWWDLQKAAAAMVAGRFTEALNLFEQAHSARPEFRPPLRYMTALYAHSGQNEKAVQTAMDLSRLESDFSIRRSIEDDDYPNSLIKRDIGFNMERLSALA